MKKFIIIVQGIFFYYQQNNLLVDKFKGRETNFIDYIRNPYIGFHKKSPEFCDY